MNKLEALGVAAKLALALSSDRILIIARNPEQSRAQSDAVFEVLNSLGTEFRRIRGVLEDRIVMSNGAVAIFRALERGSCRGMSAQTIIADEVAWQDAPGESRATFAPVFALAKEVIWR